MNNRIVSTLKTTLTIIIMIILILSISAIVIPVLYPKPSMYLDLAFTDENINRSTIVLTKFDPFQPTFSIISPLYPETEGYQVVTIKPKRYAIVLWDIENATPNISVIKNKNKNEVIEIAKKYDLSQENPDPSNILNEKSDQNYSKAVSNEDLYFYGIEKTEDRPNSIEPFKRIDKQYNRIKVIETVGRADKGISPGIATGLQEYLYRVDDGDVKMVAVAYKPKDFDNDGILDPDATVERVVLIKYDRTFEDLPLEKQ